MHGCGYCEHVCPSRELSLTPRQRILVRREMVRQERQGGATPLLRALEADYQYLGINTCAGDGMCQTQCPVEIDTGALIKRFRHRGHSPRAEAVAHGIAKRYAIAEPLARTSLRVGHVVQSSLGSGAMIGVTGLIRRVVGNELFPLWSKDMPRPTSGQLPDTTKTGAQAVYFPACINRIFGHSPGELSGMTLPEAFVALTRRAGVPVYIPENVAGICCGTPWHSKGYVDGNKLMANKSIERCWGGRPGEDPHSRGRKLLHPRLPHLPQRPHAGEPGQVRPPRVCRQRGVCSRRAAPEAADRSQAPPPWPCTLFAGRRDAPHHQAREYREGAR